MRIKVKQRRDRLGFLRFQMLHWPVYRFRYPVLRIIRVWYHLTSIMPVLGICSQMVQHISMILAAYYRSALQFQYPFR